MISTTTFQMASHSLNLTFNISSKKFLKLEVRLYVSRTSEGAISGIFMYDDSEKLGTIYTQSREVFDYFYELKPFNFLFAEMRSEVENEIYDIYTVDLENHAIAHRFSHEISMAEEGGA